MRSQRQMRATKARLSFRWGTGDELLVWSGPARTERREESKKVASKVVTACRWTRVDSRKVSFFPCETCNTHRFSSCSQKLMAYSFPSSEGRTNVTPLSCGQNSFVAVGTTEHCCVRKLYIFLKPTKALNNLLKSNCCEQPNWSGTFVKSSSSPPSQEL